MAIPQPFHAWFFVWIAAGYSGGGHLQQGTGRKAAVDWAPKRLDHD
jgi:hypothetical protein